MPRSVESTEVDPVAPDVRPLVDAPPLTLELVSVDPGTLLDLGNAEGFCVAA